MFKYIKDNQIFFKTYFKLENICPDVPIQYHVELAEKYYDNKFIDYHIEFFRAGLNAIIKKWGELMRFFKYLLLVFSILLFTFAPTHLLPTFVCTLYAKSIGVAPAGSSTTSPFGVNT